jgi:hypothetical protein
MAFSYAGRLRGFPRRWLAALPADVNEHDQIPDGAALALAEAFANHPLSEDVEISPLNGQYAASIDRNAIDWRSISR